MCPRVKKLGIILAVLVVLAGCGKNEDYKERYLMLQEQYKKEIAQLQSRREKENKDYERRLSQSEVRLDALGEKLSRAEEQLAAREVKGRWQSEAFPSGGGKISKLETAQTGGEPQVVMDTAGPPLPTPPGMDKLWKGFMEDYASRVEEGRRGEFKKDFSEYIAGLREQSAEAADSRRRERLLESLQQRLSGTADDNEKEELERRMERIKNAGDEDLAGILDYYQKLDNIRSLKRLMDEYNISREELRESGVEPPPRDSWAPDVKEIAFNLRNFVNSYEPLTAADQREQYRQDFEKYLTDLTTPPTDEQVRQRRDQMLAALEERARTATDERKARLERAIRSLQNPDLSAMRRSVQSSKLRDLNALVEKYNIPRDELRQSGALFSRGANWASPMRIDF